MAESATLQGSGLSHDFGDARVLDDVTVTLRQGEWVAVTGPSGSGKTTLLSILGGMLSPRRGAVVATGPAGERLAVSAAVSWVLQTTTALGTRSVLDNAALGGLSDGLRARAAAERAAAVLDRVGLSHRLRHRARELSGGELQRLSIARALSSTRPFMLADEPTGQVDQSTSDRVLAAMRAAAQDVGVLIATHDLNVARECDRVLHVVDGKVAAVEA